MHHRLLLITSLGLIVSCSSGDDNAPHTETSTSPQTTKAQTTEAEPPPVNAAVVANPDLPSDRPPSTPPLTGTHLDSASSSYRPRGYQPVASKGRHIELFLRSTPPGALASIDGKSIGTTPSYWRGRADGRSHEYTFTKDGYAMARYRFVATQDGVVHGSLTRLVQSQETTTPKESAAGP